MTPETSRLNRASAPNRSGTRLWDVLRRNPIRLAVLAFLILLLAIAVRNLTPQAGLAPEYEADQFLRNLMSGLAQGSVYALIALGYSLIYSVLGAINFAHGEVFMAGAYLGFFAAAGAERSGLLARDPMLTLMVIFVVAMCASALVAVVLERVAFRPLSGGPRLSILLAAIGASIVLQQLFGLLFGSSPRRYPDFDVFILPQVFTSLECVGVGGQPVCRGLNITDGRYDVALFGLDVRILPIHFLMLGVGLILMLALVLFMRRTRAGRAIRSVAEDRVAAALMGVNVDRVIVLTFVLAAMLAGAGGVLFSLYNQQVSPTLGFLPGIKAFTAAALGGIGTLRGAIYGGFLLGLFEAIIPPLLGIPVQLRDVVTFALLVGVLVLRPQGLLGVARVARSS